eukprot:4708824-Pleurochrysis_carterae.AAC.1
MRRLSTRLACALAPLNAAELACSRDNCKLRARLVHDVLEAVERRGGVEHEARLAAGGADQLQRAVL